MFEHKNFNCHLIIIWQEQKRQIFWKLDNRIDGVSSRGCLGDAGMFVHCCWHNKDKKHKRDNKIR